MRICAIGLGRLGLPWALVADAAGHEVVGVDIDPARVAAVESRVLDTPEPEVAELLRAEGCRLRATTDVAEAIEGAEVIQSLLGWQPSVSREDGLEVTYRWIFDQVVADRAEAGVRR